MIKAGSLKARTINLLGRRRKYLINPDFQWSFLSYWILIAGVVSAVYFGATRYFFWKIAVRATEVGIPADHVFFRFLDSQKGSLDWIFLGSSLLIIVFLLGFGLYLSNRVAGPIYNAQNYLRSVREGKNIGDLKFREHDYFHELADEINETLKNRQG